jgi:hypothetical protein
MGLEGNFTWIQFHATWLVDLLPVCIPCCNLTPRHHLDVTGTASGDTLATATAAISWDSFLHENTNTFVVPVQTPGLPDLSLVATRTPIFGPGGRQQAPFSDTLLYQTGRGFAANILLRPSRTILGLPQTRQLLSSKFRSTQTGVLTPGPPELVLTNHAHLTARDVTDPIINDCHIRNRGRMEGYLKVNSPNKQ